MGTKSKIHIKRRKKKKNQKKHEQIVILPEARELIKSLQDTSTPSHERITLQNQLYDKEGNLHKQYYKRVMR